MDPGRRIAIMLQSYLSQLKAKIYQIDKKFMQWSSFCSVALDSRFRTRNVDNDKGDLWGFGENQRLLFSPMPSK